MGDNSKIEWTNATWNPVTGCSKVSAGCRGCYAERHAHRFWGDRKFTDVQTHDDRLDQPIRWKKGRLIFVNSMSDLFHEDVPFTFVEKVFDVMRRCPHHTFQILTKRPERMLEYFTAWPSAYGTPFEPLPNVWLGVSVENQEAADKRIPLLLQTPAAVRFISAEPLISPVDLTRVDVGTGHVKLNALTGAQPAWEKLDWVIVGGESGPTARPLHPEWVRQIVTDCVRDDVPVFFKQWGEWKPVERLEVPGNIGVVMDYWGIIGNVMGVLPQGFERVGKEIAGNMFGGIQLFQMPKNHQ